MSDNNEALVARIAQAVFNYSVLYDVKEPAGWIKPIREALSAAGSQSVPDKVLLEALQDELQSEYDTDGHEGPEGDAAIRLCDAMGAVESVLSRLRSQFSAPGEWQCAHAHDGAYGWEIFKAGTHERLCGDMTEAGAMTITAALNSAPAPAASPVVPEACEWHEDEEGVWQSDCGAYYSINDDTPEKNGMKFCLGCGKPLRTILPASDLSGSDGK